jgi:hypothetical protein
MSGILPSEAASIVGKKVEPFIFSDYCQVNPPCGIDDFFDLSPSFEPYENFLKAHNPGKSVPAIIVGESRRPDILSHRVTSPAEFYEIKPFTPTGVRDGLAKLTLLSFGYPAFGYPYKAGKQYNPTPAILLHRFTTDAEVEEDLDLFLDVHRPIPGLILYRFCIKGDYIRYFNRVRVIAGVLAILVVLAPELLPAAEAGEVVAEIQALASVLGIVLPILRGN